MSTIDERQKKMLTSIEEKTGQKSDAIIADIKAQNLEKHGQKINFVKEKYELSHGFANLLAHLSKADFSLGGSEYTVQAQYVGKESLMAIYTAVEDFLGTLEDVEMLPKKAYVTIRSKKQFAIIQPTTKTRVDLGLKFPKNYETDLEPAGSFNTMMSHRIRLSDPKDFNKAAKQHLMQAYEMSIQ